MEGSNNGSSLMNQSSICLKMRELIEAINEYTKNRTGSSALVINKFLQAYSVTIDASAFDPENGLGAQFYVSLHNLFNSLEPDSDMAWNCVDVLCNACRNASARQALIETYQFVPMLSKLLNDQLSTCKKKKLLVLLQDLTCGIKLSWQVSHLPHLLKILTKWVEDKNQDITCLSLSVLVNLCFKNLPVVYTLSRIIDIKKFLRFCLPLQGPLVEIHVCKLMILLNHLNDDIPKITLLHLISPTFNSIQESLTKNDPVMLRSVIDFFIDMISSENKEVFKEYGHYSEQLEALVKSIHSRQVISELETTPLPQQDPECVMLTMKFIYALEYHKLSDFSKLYSAIVKLALDWVNCDKVSFHANMLLTIVTQNLCEGTDHEAILKLLGSKLPVFLSMIQTESLPANMDACKRLRSLLQLLRMMLKANSITSDVVKSINENLSMNIFAPILAEDFNGKHLPLLKAIEDKTSSTEYVDTYVYAIVLVYELSQHNAKLLESLSVLMENRNIQSILAIALYGSNSEIKQLVLELTRSSRFPISKIASALETSQTMFCNNKNSVASWTSSSTMYNPVYPMLGYAQMEMVDDTLKNFKKLIDEQNVSNVSVSQVIELYEYKVASLANSELSASKNLEAASERCVHLQHRLAQFSEEHNKLGQLIHHYDNRLEKSEKAMNDLKSYCLDEKKKADTEIENWQRCVKNHETKLKEIKVELLQMTEQKENLEVQIKKFQSVIEKLEENGNRVEKQLQTRENQINNANSHINGLNGQIKDLRKTLEQKEAKLTETTKQYLATKEILSTITKLSGEYRS